MKTITVHIITRASPEFDTLRWVLRARGDDPTRMVLQCLHVDGDRTVVATDGRRMHYTDPLPGLDLAPGTYEVLGMDESEIHLTPHDGVYPHWRAVIPQTDKQEELKAAETSIYVADIFAKAQTYIQHNYIFDALMREESSVMLNWKSDGDGLEAIRLDVAHGHAVIMPLRRQ